MRYSLFVLILLAHGVALAQEQPHYFTPIPGEGQNLRGSIAANEGAVGVATKKVDGGFKVAATTPAGPAEKSGLQIGDVITVVDGNSVTGFGQADFYRLLAKKPGETVQIGYVRNGQQSQVTVSVESRGQVYPADAKLPPLISQFLFDGHAVVTASISQAPSQSQSIMVGLQFSNIDAQILTLDDSKFFVLDGQGQQLRHMALDEIKYSIRSWVARNWHGGNYQAPPPPPAQHHYIITGTQNGNYTFSEMGNMGTVTGNSTSTYNVQEQPDYSQSGWYSLGLALRQRADKKHNNEIVQQALAAVSQWDGTYFRSQSPVIPGENRGGAIVYWSGSSREVAPPFKLVMFLTDPSTGKQEMVKFEFLLNPPAQAAVYARPIAAATSFAAANTPPPAAPSPVVVLGPPQPAAVRQPAVSQSPTPSSLQPPASPVATTPAIAPAPRTDVQPAAPTEPTPAESKLELTITSDPAGAAVEINGISVGATPITVAMTPGATCSIAVKKDGFVPWKMTYPTSAAGKFNLNANLTKEVFR